MGLIADIARGEHDYIYGDPEILSDPRTWQKQAKEPKDEEVKVTDSHIDDKSHVLTSDSEQGEER